MFYICYLPYALIAEFVILWQINLVHLFFDVVGGQQMHFIALRMTTVHTSSVWLLFYGQPL
jgi:hypothetical protein